MPKKHSCRLFLRIFCLLFAGLLVRSSLRSVQNQHQMDAVNRCKSDVPRTSCDPGSIVCCTACETSFRLCMQKNKVSQILRYLVLLSVPFLDYLARTLRANLPNELSVFLLARSMPKSSTSNMQNNFPKITLFLKN